MALLSNLVQTREIFRQGAVITDNVGDNSVDTNILKGCYITAIAPHVDLSTFCWSSPSSGTAIIEIWGASGTSANSCCCGISLPGNSGAYAKKTVEVTASSFVCGTVGSSVVTGSVPSTTNSAGTCMFIGNTSTGDTCLCAQGGLGGRSICETAASPVFNCFVTAFGVCNTSTGVGCGIVCNYTGVSDNVSAFGGDINCNGAISCLKLQSCGLSASSAHSFKIGIPAGILTKTTQSIEIPFTNTNGAENGSGTKGLVSYVASIGQWSTAATPIQFCWASEAYDTTLTTFSCQGSFPAGIPSPSTFACGGLIDYAFRGGPGMIKIKFISN